MQVSPKIRIVLVVAGERCHILIFSHSRFGLCYFGLCSKSTSIKDGTCRWMCESTEMVLYCKLMQDRIVALTARFTTALSRVELM